MWNKPTYIRFTLGIVYRMQTARLVRVVIGLTMILETGLSVP